MKRWELHLTYVILWLTSLLVLWGVMHINNSVDYWGVVAEINKEPYSLKQKLYKSNKLVQALGTEVMRVNRKLEIEKEKNNEGKG